ncbi:MAG: hypothetical protein ACK46Q_10705 [Hyphomonas sp.]
MLKYLAAFCGVALAVSVMPAAHASGGPYVVDDAGITDPGMFKLESWASHANNGSRAYVIAPGFTPASLPFVEFELGIERRRAGGDWETTFAPAAKIAVREVGADRFGLALVMGTAHSGNFRTTETAYASIPLTVPVNDALHLHFNAGLERDLGNSETAGMFGVAAQSFVSDRLEIIGEVFGGQTGRVGWQAGLRPIVLDGSLALDFAYGRNLEGERGDWLTFGISTGF